MDRMSQQPSSHYILFQLAWQYTDSDYDVTSAQIFPKCDLFIVWRRSACSIVLQWISSKSNKMQDKIHKNHKLTEDILHVRLFRILERGWRLAGILILGHCLVVFLRSGKITDSFENRMKLTWSERQIDDAGDGRSKGRSTFFHKPVGISPSVLWYCWLGLLTCKKPSPI